MKLGYSGDALLQGSVIRSYERLIPLNDTTKLNFSAPDWTKTTDISSFVQTNGKKLAMIRPVTLRKEWLASSRAPNPEYIFQLSEHLYHSGWHVVSVCDTSQGEEWIVGQEPMAHQKFHHGELIPTNLFSLAAQADLVVGGVGWIAPVCLSTNTPVFIVGGGCLAYNSKHKITDLRMDLRNYHHIIPDRACYCTESVHNCSKLISQLDEHFFDFVTSRCYKHP